MTDFIEQNPVAADGSTPPVEPSSPAPEGSETPAPEGTPAAPSAEVTPPAEGAPTPEVTETPVDYAARVAEWGGMDAIDDAIAIASALKDEAGVRALVEEGLRHLGKDPATVFGTADTTPVVEEDPDEVITRADLQAALEADRAARAAETDAGRLQAAAQAVDDARTALDITEEEEWDLVRTFAQKYATPDERDPAVLKDAVNKGYADMTAAVEKAARKHVTDRKDANDKVPQPIVGGGSGDNSDPPPPPKSLDEGRAAARRYLQSTGDV